MSVSRIYRLLRIVSLLQGRRTWTADELAEELQVSRRTVFRDLNLLELAHIPYYTDPERGGYRIRRDFFLPPVNMTLSEALSLLALAELADPSTNVPLLAEARRASAKLESMLPPAILESVGSVLDKLSVSLPPVADHDGTEDIFDRLSHAAADRLICRIRYNSFHDGEIINLTVHPLHLAFKSRAWYLRAFSCEHNQRRTFKLSRIEQVTVTEETFLPPADGSDGGFGLAWSMIPEGQVFDVLLRFSPKVAGNVAEVQWHPTQQIEHNEGGSIDFRVRVDGIGEISWWVLGYGSEVEVLAPQQLRDRVASTARKMLEIYEGANPCER